METALYKWTHLYYYSQKLSSIFSSEPAASDEKRLLRMLLNRYDRIGRYGRPVLNVSQPVLVQFGLGATKMDLLEAESVLYLSAWGSVVSSVHLKGRKITQFLPKLIVVLLTVYDIKYIKFHQ